MKVINLNKNDMHLVYIGRPSIFGNPFLLKDCVSRAMCLAKYEAYARQNAKVMRAIRALPKNAILCCFCHPEPCHGDIIKQIWKEHKNG